MKREEKRNVEKPLALFYSSWKSDVKRVEAEEEVQPYQVKTTNQMTTTVLGDSLQQYGFEEELIQLFSIFVLLFNLTELILLISADDEFRQCS